MKYRSLSIFALTSAALRSKLQRREKGRPSRAKNTKGRALRLENLEDRALLDAAGLTTFDAQSETPSLIVNTASDDVNPFDEVISLREAIEYAAEYPELGSKIEFAPEMQGATIALSGSELKIEQSVEIDASAIMTEDGPGVTIDAAGQSRVFNVSGASTQFDAIGLNIVNGATDDNGGGIYVLYATTNLDQCVLTNNTAKYGGAVYVGTDGNVSFNECLVYSNEASYYGGGLYNINGTSDVFHSVFAFNNAYRGGAIYVVSGSVSMDNCLLAQNTTSNNGAAIYAFSGATSLTDCTVAGNYGVTGGGIYVNSDSIELRNTIVADNTGTASGDDVYVYPGAEAYAYNVLSSFVDWTSAESAFQYEIGQPLFQEDGYELAGGSLAIDSGNNDYVVSEFDLAGEERIYNDVVDLGAFESKLPVAPTAVWVDAYDSTTGDLNFSWNEGKFADDYVVQIKIGEGDWQIVDVESTFEEGVFSTVVSQIRVGETFQCAVQSSNEYGLSGATESDVYYPQAALSSIEIVADGYISGSTFEAINVASDAWEEISEVAATYQWYRGSEEEGWTAIEGATDSVYVSTEADENAFLKVVATGAAPYYYGDVEAITVRTVYGEPDAPEAVWVADYDATTSTITLCWNAVEEAVEYDSIVCINDGEWNELKIKSYTTVEDGIATAVFTGVNPGAYQQFGVASVNPRGKSDTTYSDVFYPRAELASVTVDATFYEVGDSFSTTVEVAALDPRNVSVAYQWYRGSEEAGWTTIEGATQAEYTSDVDDIGLYLKVVAQGTGDFYYGEVEGISAQPIYDHPAFEIWTNEYDPETATISLSWNDLLKAESYVVMVSHNGGDWNLLDIERFTTYEDGIATAVFTGVNPGSYRQYSVYGIYADGELSPTAYSDLFYPRAEVKSVSIANESFEIGAEFSATAAIGAKDPRKVSVDYQWYRGSEEEGWTAIEGATQADYVATSDDAFLYLKVVAQGTGDYYYGEAEAVTDGPIEYNPDFAIWTNEYDPETATLSLSWNDLDKAESYVVMVSHNGGAWNTLNIARYTTYEDGIATAVFTGVNPGSYRQYSVYANYGAGRTSETVYSDFFYPQASVASVSVDAESYEVGSAFTANVEIAAKDPRNIAVDYQWYRGSEEAGWTAIEGANKADYVTGDDDIGLYLKVVAQGTGDYYYGEAEAVTDGPIEYHPTFEIWTNEYDPELATLSLSWNQLRKAESYVVKVSHNGGDWNTLNIGRYTTYEDGIATAVFTGVNPGSYRQYSVCAVYADGSESETVYSELFYPQASVASVAISNESYEAGSTFSASVEIAAKDPRKVAVDYQWYRGSEEEGWTAIEGATKANYVATDADAGLYLKVVAQGKGDYYYGEAEAVTDATIVAKPVPTPDAIWFNSYDPEAATISLSWNEVENAADYVVEVLHNGKGEWGNLNIQRFMTFEDGIATVAFTGVNPGSNRQYRVFAKSADGRLSEPAYSALFYPTADLASAVVVSESYSVGASFSATVEIAAKDPRNVAVNYQWYRGSEEEGWTAIAKATKATYVATDADAGCFLKVVAQGKGAYYYGTVEATTDSAVESAFEDELFLNELGNL